MSTTPLHPVALLDSWIVCDLASRRDWGQKTLSWNGYLGRTSAKIRHRTYDNRQWESGDFNVFRKAHEKSLAAPETSMTSPVRQRVSSLMLQGSRGKGQPTRLADRYQITSASEKTSWACMDGEWPYGHGKVMGTASARDMTGLGGRTLQYGITHPYLGEGRLSERSVLSTQSLIVEAGQRFVLRMRMWRQRAAAVA